MKETTALAKRETVDVVAERIRVFQDNGEIQFPENYSPEKRTLKSAWLNHPGNKRPKRKSSTRGLYKRKYRKRFTVDGNSRVKSR